MPLALPELLILAGLLVAYGLITMSQAFLEFLAKIIKLPIGGIPIIDKLTGGIASRAVQSLADKMGHAADGIGAEIARNWNLLATIVDRIGWSSFHLGLALERLLAEVTVIHPLERLWKMAKGAYSLAGRAGHAAGHALHGHTVIQQFISRPTRAALTKAVQAAIGPFAIATHKFERWARTQIAAEGGVATDVVTAPTKIGYTPRALRRLRLRVSKLEALTVGAGVAALVATGLGRLGLGWLRCDSFRRLGRGIGCTGFAALEDLLAPAVEALVITDLCRFALLTQALVREIRPALGVFILVENAVCLGGGASLPSAADKPIHSAHIALPSATG